MKVLLLGSSGYIGSRLKQYLEVQDMQVTGIDAGWFGLEASDTLLDYKNLTADYVQKFDTVICLAGHSSVKMCELDIQHSWRNNVNNFVELAKKMVPGQKLIYASSGSVYGNSNVHTTGSFSFNPINNYDITKYVLDLSASQLMALDTSPTIIGLRFGTVNGASDNFRAELMLNAMVKNALVEKKINVNNGSIHRPVLALGDLVRAISDIVRAKDVGHGIYDLFSFNDTVNNLVMKVRDHLIHMGIDIQVNPDRPGVYDFVMDNTAFCQAFNFKFNYDADGVIQELVEFFNADIYNRIDTRNTPWSYE